MKLVNPNKLEYIEKPAIKLLIYMDSTGCASCNINNLYKLNEFVEMEPSICFYPYVIFNPSEDDKRFLYRDLQLNTYLFPIYVDEYNEFEFLNPWLPSDNKYRSFLIDKNNIVTLIGNPIMSDSIWDLFKGTINNMRANDGIYIPNTKYNN